MYVRCTLTLRSFGDDGVPSMRVRDAGEAPLASVVLDVGAVLVLFMLIGVVLSLTSSSSLAEAELGEVSANLTVVLRWGVGLMVDPNLRIAALCSVDRESHAFCLSGERDFYRSEERRADLWRRAA